MLARYYSLVMVIGSDWGDDGSMMLTDLKTHGEVMERRVAIDPEYAEASARNRVRADQLDYAGPWYNQSTLFDADDSQVTVHIVNAPDPTPAEVGLFIAGGITGCADWQTMFAGMVSDGVSGDSAHSDAGSDSNVAGNAHIDAGTVLSDDSSDAGNAPSDLREVTIVNPRRYETASSDIDPLEQIRWEHRALAASRIVSFWFPATSVCPITLFELGKQTLRRDAGLIVGVDPDYPRRVDVEEQLRLERPDVRIVHTLDDLVDMTVDRMQSLLGGTA